MNPLRVSVDGLKRSLSTVAYLTNGAVTTWIQTSIPFHSLILSECRQSSGLIDGLMDFLRSFVKQALPLSNNSQRYRQQK